MDFMDFSRRLYRWASEGVDMYGFGGGRHSVPFPLSASNRYGNASNLPMIRGRPNEHHIHGMECGRDGDQTY